MSGLGRYAALFEAPSVRQVVVAGLLARLPLGMVPIGTVLLVRGAGHSYAVVGAVVAALSVAIAVAAPVVGRLVDRVGQSRVLIPLSLLFPTFLALLVWLANEDVPALALLVVAAATGATLPPVGACIRAIWPSMLPAHGLRETAYALEAWLQELSFILGPVLVGVLAAFASASAAMLVAAALGLAGTLWFALTPPVQAAGGHRNDVVRSRVGALGSPGVRTVIFGCIALGCAFGVIEVTMPAFAEIHGTRSEGGFVLACFASGSLIGGVWSGTRPAPLRPELRFAGMLAALGVLLVPLLLAPSLPVACGLIVFAGIPIAPAFASSYGLVDRLAVPGTTTEAFSWLSTAIVSGVSLGTAVGGLVIEHVGVTWSLALAPPSALVAAAVVFALRSSLAPAT